ncbi:TPA: citrate lyase subunit alpha [Escherichia coli]
MTQKIEQSQRQERVAAWNRRAECDLAAFQNSPKQTYQAEKARDRKLCANLEEAIRRSGLQDGMTVSFHHAFRGGDLTVNMVMDVIAKMGFKNLTLASSSLSDCHAPLVEHIRQGVVTRIYTSGLRGPLAEEISRGLLAEPVQIHSHGGRVHLVQSGELNIDVAFLGVPSCDEFGNANGYTGKACCGSLGYAMVDADNAKQVVMLTEELLPYPHNPASIEQDQVDLIVKVDRVGDAAKIGAGATRMTTNPRELLIARSAADVIVNSGYFKEGFSMQTGTGGASLAVTRFLEDKMRSRDIRADFALGGITATMVDLHEKGLIRKLLDVQSFDSHAAQSLARNPNHIEISANQYANWGSKGASVDRLDVVVLSALEIDTQFNVNVLTGSDGVLRGASGGHCDTAIASALSIIVAPLVRGRIPTLVDNVLTCITPGSSVDILVTDHGIAVNPARPELAERLQEAVLHGLRPIGMACEGDMFRATAGVNTHKGSIFSLGLLCAAIGRLLQLNQPVTPTTVCSTAASFCRGLTDRELRTNNSQLTAGQRLYQQLGLTGARGEAEAGYPLVINHALPHYLTLLDQGLDPELALLDTLLLLMAINGDTNVASRGGEGGLRWLQREAQTLLQKGGIRTPADLDYLRQFDRECIERNLSPGGSADLLILTWFLAQI